MRLSGGCLAFACYLQPFPDDVMGLKLGIRAEKDDGYFAFIHASHTHTHGYFARSLRLFRFPERGGEGASEEERERGFGYLGGFGKWKTNVFDFFIFYL